MQRAQGKVCVITGAALGIGRACALRLAGEGARIALFDVLDDDAGILRDELRAAGSDAECWHVDVSDESQVRSAIDAVAARFGRIDVLVNNAGIAGANKPTDQLTEAEWDRVQAINVKGVFFCVKHAIPHLRHAGGVNMASTNALGGEELYAAYNASKGAVRLMSKTDAMLYAADAIRVNSVHPGFIWTPMVQHHLEAGGDVEAARAGCGTASAGPPRRTR